MKNKIKFLGVLVISLFLMPINTLAEEMSDEFRSYLNEDGKLVVNSVRVESGIEFVFEYLFSMDENGEYLDNGICYDIAENMNSVDFTIHCWEDDKKETHNVEIVYNYDETIKSQIDGYMNRIPEDLEYFEVRDLEVVNYWLNGGNIIDYSSQLKEMFDYKNFKMDFRAGGGDRFVEDAMGNAQFMYNRTLYGIREHTGISAKHIIYIDESVGNTKEAVVAAVQKRIDDYLGEGKVIIEYGGEGIYNSYIDAFDANIESYQAEHDRLKVIYDQALLDEEKWCRSADYDLDKCNEAQEKSADAFWDYNGAKSDLEYEQMYKDSFIASWNDPNSDMAFLKDALNDWYFAAVIDFGDYTSMYEFIVMKDTSKMINPSIKTSDLSTNVEISTNANLPLDTKIEATKLTSGEEYEKIVKVLKNSNIEAFDLNLYSDSIEDYIRKLEDGTFEVKIPISEKFKGKEKDLVVYYVSNDGKIEPFTVEPKDGYAVFTTNHFSTYTLATTNDVLPPKTGDGITTYFVIGLISVLGIIGVALYLKKAKIK